MLLQTPFDTFAFEGPGLGRGSSLFSVRINSLYTQTINSSIDLPAYVKHSAPLSISSSIQTLKHTNVFLFIILQKSFTRIVRADQHCPPSSIYLRLAVNVSIRNQKAKQRRLWIVSRGSELLPAVCAWDRLSRTVKNCAAIQMHWLHWTTKSSGLEWLFSCWCTCKGDVRRKRGELMLSRRRRERLLILSGWCLECSVEVNTACVCTANQVVDVGREKSPQWQLKSVFTVKSSLSHAEPFYVQHSGTFSPF